MTNAAATLNALPVQMARLAGALQAKLEAEGGATAPADTAPADTAPADTAPGDAGPAAALIPVEGNAELMPASGAGIILAAVDASPVAALVTEAAAVLAAGRGDMVHVVHTQEEATAGDVAIDGESLEAARAMVRAHLDRLAAHHVPAEGQVLLHAADHGAAGRMVAEYANAIGAGTIVVGAPRHGGLAALMDGSASRELWRHARSNVLVVNPDAPGTRDGRPGRADSDRADAELLRG
jgi:nucleotide-binding universal stress UspA family protein